MRRLLTILLASLLPASAQVESAPAGPPARLHVEDLKEFPTLSEARRKLIENALAVLNDSPPLPYLNGSADPKAGGFDCSGAMYFVLRKCGLEPPRSSPGQFAWLKENQRLHEIPPEVADESDPSLALLKPGDLLFWTKMDTPPLPRVHHVAMYLGTEKKDGRPVMINATDGRSYRGKKANGYGVYDFRVPKPDSPSKLAGYGTPPGIGED